MSEKISVTFKAAGQPERLLLMDPAQAAMLKTVIGKMINVDGDQFYVTNVLLRLGTAEPAGDGFSFGEVRLRVEGKFQ